MALQTFLVAYLVSFIGSIPPGAINISVMQLSIQDHRRAAFFLSVGAGLTEMIYAGITIAFFRYLLNNADINKLLFLITGIFLVVLGIFNIRSRSTSKSYNNSEKMKGRMGFTRGVILGILNPLTIPFWLAVTGYLAAHNWISLENIHYWMYVLGLSSGTICLLWCVDLLGSKFRKVADNRLVVHIIPGLLFIVMGIFNLLELLKL